MGDCERNSNKTNQLKPTGRVKWILYKKQKKKDYTFVTTALVNTKNGVLDAHTYEKRSQICR